MLFAILLGSNLIINPFSHFQCCCYINLYPEWCSDGWIQTLLLLSGLRASKIRWEVALGSTKHGGGLKNIPSPNLLDPKLCMVERAFLPREGGTWLQSTTNIPLSFYLYECDANLTLPNKSEYSIRH